jgi:predicted glycosyltransferase
MTKILYISGSLGLGHAGRDMAIANELRRMVPGVEIVWLADPPATMYLRGAGETVLSDYEGLGPSDSSNFIADAEGKDYSLNLYWLWLKWYPTFEKRAKMAMEIAKREKVDLIVGDETYDVYTMLQGKKIKKDVPFLLILDFFGGHMYDGIPKKKFYLWMFQRWTVNHAKQFYGKEGTLFIGEPDDVHEESLGFMLGEKRELAKKYLVFTGYVLQFDPADYRDQLAAKKQLGYGPEPLAIVTIGGTAICKPLLDLAAKAYPIMQARMPKLKMILIAGPNVPLQEVQAPEGVEVKGMVQNLYRHLAAADLTITSGGGTTCLELQALQRPFIYFPIAQHFEQQTDVSWHLERDHIGRKMEFAKTTPEALAAAALEEIGRKVSYPEVSKDGHVKAAEHIALTLGRVQKGEIKAS